MEWLNIHTSDLDSSEFVGEGPVARGTWLCLLRFCAGQENGGVIKGCAQWPDRRWQQIARVTKEEVMEKTALWVWDGDDLLVWGYPISSEAKIAAKRKAGAAGGRSKSEAKASAARENGAKQSNKQSQSESQANTQANTQAEAKQTPKVREGKERKGKEMEGNSCATNFVDSEEEVAPGKPSRAENENTDSLPVFSLSCAEDGTSIAQAPEKPASATEGGKAGHQEEKQKPQKRERPRNPLFDALAEATGENPEIAGGRIGKALSAIVKAMPDVTPEEIQRRAKNYTTHFRDAALSSTALASWWARCAEAARARIAANGSGPGYTEADREESRRLAKQQGYTY